jgi:exodeoxyribonuclease VII large subunit
MSVYYVLSETHILVKGKTYPYREKMRLLGAQYNAVDKSWTVPHTPENASLLAEFCRSVGGGPIKETVLPERPPSISVSVPTSLSTYKAPSLSSLGSVDIEPAAEAMQGLSIAELMRKAQLAIAQNFPRSLWVIGEIQNIRFHNSGVYFQLADSKEGGSQSATVTVNATLWKSQLRELERTFGETLKDLLQDGFRVRVLADLTLFKDRGQLSLQIQSIDPNFTKGSLALQRETLLKELRAKGLDKRNKTLALTPFPLRVGLLSAEDSRAKSDFIDQLRIYGFAGEVIFRPCQMQGEATLKDVVSGLKFLQESTVDVIVMTRGGGSAADLRWFDSREIAFAIAECRVPVVAAIGHHEDVCVAEDICYQREKTPTAAADFIISLFARTRERLDQLSLSLDKTLNDRMKLFDAYLVSTMEKMRSAAQSQLGDQMRVIAQAQATLELNWQRRLLQWTGRIEQVQATLDRSLDLRIEKERARVERAGVAFSKSLDLQLQREAARIDKASASLQARASLLMDRAVAKLKETSKDLRRAALDAVRDRETSAQRLDAIIKQSDPKPWMAQGWTQLFDDRGPIKEGAQVKIGQAIKARLTDSLLSMTIDEIKSSKEGKL